MFVTGTTIGMTPHVSSGIKAVRVVESPVFYSWYIIMLHALIE